MSIAKKRKDFIDRTARKPHGEKGISIYNEPKAHYKSFRIILEKLNLTSRDEYFEIGCGGGSLLRRALEKARSGAAIDHSSDMVGLSIKNNRQAVDKGRLEITQGNAEQLPWTDNMFTAGASSNMFFFVRQPQKTLNEIFRVLKPGGRFAMVTMSNSLLGKISFGWFYSLKTYSNRTMDSMLREAGFLKIEVKTRGGIYQVCYAVKPL